jgi:hypothetical protein
MTEAPPQAIAARPGLAAAWAARQKERAEGMAFARAWKEHHRRAGTVWGIPPQPVERCSKCGRPL